MRWYFWDVPLNARNRQEEESADACLRFSHLRKGAKDEVVFLGRAAKRKESSVKAVSGCLLGPGASRLPRQRPLLTALTVGSLRLGIHFSPLLGFQEEKTLWICESPDDFQTDFCLF